MNTSWKKPSETCNPSGTLCEDRGCQGAASSGHYARAACASHTGSAQCTLHSATDLGYRARDDFAFCGPEDHQTEDHLRREGQHETVGRANGA